MNTEIGTSAPLDGQLKSIAILGSGLHAWALAAALGKYLLGTGTRVTLVDCVSDGQPDDTTHGVTAIAGDSRLHELLEFDEQTLMQGCNGTFQTATRFVDWHHPDHDFYIGYGQHGAKLGTADFHHYLTYQRQNGSDLRLESFSPGAVMASLGRFSHPPQDSSNILSTMEYLQQFDAAAYLAHMQSGVKQLQQQGDIDIVVGQLNQVNLRSRDGYIESLVLDDGVSVTADLFVDCSGAEGRLIDQAMYAKYIDWSQHLPFDRSLTVSVPTSVIDNTSLSPLNTIFGDDLGWIKQIFLNGKAVYQCQYSSDHSSFDEVLERLSLMANAEPPTAIKSQILRPGCRDKFWFKNCVAMGAAAGYVDSLHYTQGYVMDLDIQRFIGLIPFGSDMTIFAAEYNRLSSAAYSSIRDYHSAHYWSLHSAPRPHCYFQFYCQQLHQKINLFLERGVLSTKDDEVVDKQAWLALLYGLGLQPCRYDPFVGRHNEQQIKHHLITIQQLILREAQLQPEQIDYLSA